MRVCIVAFVVFIDQIAEGVGGFVLYFCVPRYSCVSRCSLLYEKHMLITTELWLIIDLYKTDRYPETQTGIML